MTGKLRLLCLVTVLAGTVGCRSVSTDGPPEGFTSLFNGHDLTGWTYDGSGNWRVESGLLVYDGQGWKPAPDTISTQNLRTEKEYGDFILLIDWKIAKDGNSGIVLRPDYEDYHEFEEVQVEIWDRTAEAYSSPLGSGGIVGYNVEERKPLRTADHPVGNPKISLSTHPESLVKDPFQGFAKIPPSFWPPDPGHTESQNEKEQEQRVNLKKLEAISPECQPESPASSFCGPRLAGPFGGDNDLRGLFIYNVETLEEAQGRNRSLRSRGRRARSGCPAGSGVPRPRPQRQPARAPSPCGE